ncbi:MAG: dipeptidase [Proteobacteria bacterium]|nr:dipeptidase [Pseudomonadota bacterium]
MTITTIIALGACTKSTVEPTSPDQADPGTPANPPAANPTPAQDVQPTAAKPVDLGAKATELARRFIIVDGHIDQPMRFAMSKRLTGAVDYGPVINGGGEGDFDYPRAVAGGLDAPFMSLYVPAKYQEAGGAKNVADELIDMVEALVTSAPDKFAIARSVADVRKNFSSGKVSLPLGIENGAAIEGDPANLKHFYDRGVRYITLTHSEDNEICDSSYATTRKWKGLSPIGKQVVAEMNRLGIMIDVSHISDDSFYQIMELTKVPVIASHSSARHFLPDFERNMSDDMLKKLAKNGGVIMINFGSIFINEKSRAQGQARWAAMREFRDKHNVQYGDAKYAAFVEEYNKTHEFTFADISEVADHIDHVVKLVGVDHVGFGSDFDGVGDTLPTGLKDVSMYPNLIRILLERGYSEADIEKICSGNVLRVWQAAEDYAAKNASQPATSVQ